MFAFFTPSPIQVLIVLGLGVLIFGRNLPDVAKQFGVVLGEFKKGIREITNLTKSSPVSLASVLEPTEDDTEMASESVSESRSVPIAGNRYREVGQKFVPPE